MPKEPITHHATLRYRDGRAAEVQDAISVEEPLEIVVDGHPYAITMRLPGDDLNLVRGFLFTEGVIGAPPDAATISPAGHDRVLVTRTPGDKELHRTHAKRLSTSSSGLGGKTSLDDLYADIPPVAARDTFTYHTLTACMDIAKAQPAVFSRTGSTHFAALFTRHGELLAFAEDVGRHNAFDKAIGAVINTGQTAAIAILSSRQSFEMVHKAGMLGVQILAGISAPTSQAIQLADRCRITLVGFLRGDSMNVYTHTERLTANE